MDPISAEDTDNHSTESYVLSVADYGGRALRNYRYGPVIMHNYGGQTYGMGSGSEPSSTAAPSTCRARPSISPARTFPERFGRDEGWSIGMLYPRRSDPSRPTLGGEVGAQGTIGIEEQISDWLAGQAGHWQRIN